MLERDDLTQADKESALGGNALRFYRPAVKPALTIAQYELSPENTKTNSVYVLLSTSNLTFAFPAFAKPSSCAARRVTSITDRTPRFHPVVNGNDNTLAVFKICHPDFGSVGKRLVRRSEFVFVVDRAAGRLLSLKLIAVEVGDAFFGGLSGRDPMDRTPSQDSGQR